MFAGTVRDWHDVGGESRAIHLFGRPSYSGTHAFVLERVVRHGDAHGPGQFGTGIEEVERNEDVVTHVAADAGAIGYVPFSFATGSVRAIALRASEQGEPLMPTPQTIQDGSYPASRQLLFYTRGAPQGPVAEFLRFVLSDRAHPIVVRNGFVPSDAAPDLALQQSTAGGEATLVRAPVRVRFEVDRAALQREGRHALDRLIADLLRGSARVVIVGNADDAGELQRTPTLARDRAETVAHYLRNNGIPEDRLRVESADATHPLGSNDREDGRALNRRVDVFVVQN
jgi:phosphate transport system substrate-binding protein